MENNAAQNAVTKPTSLAMGGITYNVNDNPELSAFVDAVIKYASVTEKNKLYGQMNALKTQVEALQKVEIDGTKVPQLDIEKLTNDLAAKLQTGLDALKADINTQLKPVLESFAATAAKDVEAHKQTLLTKFADKCFPDLIEGSTIEELDKAAEKSVNLHKKTFPDKHVEGGNTNNATSNSGTGSQSNTNGNNNSGTNSTNTSQNANNNTQQGSTNANTNTGNQNGNGNSNTNTGMNPPARTDVNQNHGLPDIKKMSPEEFAKNRGALKEKMKELMGS